MEAKRAAANVKFKLIYFDKQAIFAISCRKIKPEII